MDKLPKSASLLPFRGNLRLLYAASLGISALMAAASIAGLLYPESAYPGEEFHQSFAPNDLVNLAVGLPILLGSMALAARGKLSGLLLWPGALLYVFYNYLVYLFCLPLHAGYLMYLVLVMMSIYSIVGLVAAIDGKAIQDRLSGAVSERLCGGVLAGLGLLFFARILAVLLEAVLDGSPIPKSELAVNISDFMISPAWIIGGVLLWKRKALGYASGLGLLFSLSMLFVGLIFFLILQPLLTAAPFQGADVSVITVMGMIAFIPFALFLRGTASKRSLPSA